MSSENDTVYDLVIVGSGAASVCAALVAKEAGKSVVIIEKSEMFGGSTAMSGGVMWIPNNPLMTRAGAEDSYDKARSYLDACAGTPQPGSTVQRRHAFLTQGPKAIEFLLAHGLKLHYSDGYTDYHEGEYAGALLRGRSLEAAIYDLRRLGDWQARLRRRAVPPAVPPLRTSEAAALTLNGRTWKSRRYMARVGIRMLQNRFGKKLVGLGAALQGRLLEMALRRDVPIWLSSEVQQLMIHDGRAGGVVMHRNSRISHVEARSAVLLDSGGFARNAQMRARFQRAPIGSDWTSANPGDTGEIIRMAMDAGAAAHGLDQSWWVSSSVFPDGSRGQHHADMAKPHCILVDQSGRRYVNEATSYVKVGEIMYARNATVLTIPSWLIMDARHRSRYRWAGRPPGRPPAHWISSGYMMTAKSIEELARACNIDPASLQATVSRFNGFARAGRDEDFGRGVSAYSRVVGDPTVSPNASLGAIERPPFYAVRLYPGDVGTSGGLVTDEFARVLRSDGTPIYGLYAAGNCTASVVGRSYPGAGASIGAALVFGYAAAMHVIQS